MNCWLGRFDLLDGALRFAQGQSLGLLTWSWLGRIDLLDGALRFAQGQSLALLATIQLSPVTTRSDAVREHHLLRLTAAPAP